MSRHGSMLVVFAASAFLAGCSAGLDVQMATREIAADADTTFHAAEIVLHREFDRLSIDRAARRVTSEPQEFTTQSESLTSRDLVGAKSTLRRIATLSVVARGAEKSQVRLRIDRQREDTSRTETTTAGQYRLSDSPSYTPIERDAGTSTQQNTVWTSIGRDSKLERELLGELERQFSRAAADLEESRSEDDLGRVNAVPAADAPRPSSAPTPENR